MAEQVPLSGIRAVVFDKDGTLIDVHRTWGPAMAGGAARSGRRSDPPIRGCRSDRRGSDTHELSVTPRSLRRAMTRSSRSLPRSSMSTPSSFSRSSRSGCSPTPMAPSRLCRGCRRARCTRLDGLLDRARHQRREMSARRQLTGLGWLHRFERDRLRLRLRRQARFGDAARKRRAGWRQTAGTRSSATPTRICARLQQRAARVSWSMRRSVRSSRRCTWRRWPSCQPCSPESYRFGGCATMRAVLTDAVSGSTSFHPSRSALR